MIDARFRPLERPIERPKCGYKSCPFGAKWGTTLDSLERELRHLRAKEIVIEVDCDLSEIRNDGWPRTTARIRSAGVRLSFSSAHGALSYTCATYGHWEANVRAIALTLERLRAMERYGCVKGGEQYKGWAQLPPGGGASIQAGEWSTAEDAARFLLNLAGDEPGQAVFLLENHCNELEAVYRAAARKAHPDVGGSNELMSKVNRAKDFIDKHRSAA